MSTPDIGDIKDITASNFSQLFNFSAQFTVNGSFCNYTAATKWGCPPGFFCPTQNDRFRCPAGFFCPQNTAHPNYCCAKFFCKTPAEISICPENKFCPQGTTEPYTCHFFLASCPAGTERPTRVGILVVAAVVFTLIYVAFKVKRKKNEKSRLRHRIQLATITKQKELAAHGRLPSQSVRRAEKRFLIRCENLGRTLPNGIEIMKNVSVVLNPGRTMAVMGPSGAGKTTFISLLTGKTPRTSGTVYVAQLDEKGRILTEKKQELSSYRKLIGFVPQEDVMLRELTVRDILLHSARMRLPTNLSDSTKTNIVLETIDYLGLSHVADSIIGNEEERGISGGQRKRVNIGMELVAEPCVLFLDEPTSGLDSSTSLEVCQLLRRVAREKGLTVAAVIHSPSPSAFNQFDDLLLLGKGGQVVFFGPRHHAAPYFADLGFPCPPSVSESDFFMDVVSGKVPCSWNPDFIPSDLFLFWDCYQRGQAISISTLRQITETKRVIPKTVSDRLIDSFVDFFRDMHSYIVDILSEFSLHFQDFFGINNGGRSTPNSFMVFWLCFRRASYQIYRRWQKLMTECVVHLLSGAFISLASQNMDYLGKFPRELCFTAPRPFWRMCAIPEDLLRQVGLFISLGVLFAGISVGVNTFGNERVVYWRDSAAGMPTFPYFMAKWLADVPRIIIAGSMFTLSLILFWPYRGLIVNHWINITLTYFASFSMGYFLSVVFRKESVALVGTGFALAWSLVFGGVLPALNDVKQQGSIYEPISFIWDLSAPRYTVEYLYIEETSARPWEELKNDTLYFGYFRSNKSTDLRNIFAIGAAWAILAYISMKLLNRDKMK